MNGNTLNDLVLHGQAMDVPRYPFNALPGLLGDLLKERSKSPKDDAIAASVLEAVSSLCASALAVYEKPEGGTAPLSSFATLIAASGAGKSFHFGPLTQPVTEWCDKQNAQAPTNQYQQQAAHRVWEMQKCQIGKAMQECVENGKSTEAIEALMAKILSQEPLPPVNQSLLQDDASMQAVLRSLEHWPVTGWIVDEGAAALNMLRAKDFSILANLSGGKVIQHSRVGERRKEIKGFLTTLFMVQPGLFKAFCKKRGEELKASGLAARSLYHFVHDEWIGTEDDGHAIAGRAHEKYGERVTAMLDELNNRVRSGRKELPLVAFDMKSKALLNDLQKRNLGLMARPAMTQCRDFLAKLTGHIARMAAKNHVFLGLEGDVSVEFVDMAEQVCWYHFEAYKWMHNPVELEPQRVRDAATLVRWLNDRSERQFAYHHTSKVAMVTGMTTTRLRSAVAELFNQGRARMVPLNGDHYIEVLPPADRLHGVLSYGGV